MNIARKVVLITGANRGIGLALVHEALRRGAENVYAGTRGAIDFVDERVRRLRMDVTNDEEIRQAAGQVSCLDVLINNSGVAPYDNLSSRGILERTLEVNCFGM